MKVFKWIFGLILGLIVLVGVALTVLAMVIDPNDYKNDIRTAALESAGIELELDGDIGWSFFPWLALELNAVGVGYPQQPQVGRLQRVEVSVSIPALLKRELQMNRLVLDGLSLSLVKNSDGSTNWNANTEKQATQPEDSSSETSPGSAESTPLKIDIQAIEVLNAALTYTDESSHSRIELSDLNLTTGRISTEKAIPVELTFALRQLIKDQVQLSTQAELKTEILLDMANNHYQLSDLASRLQLLEGAGMPAPLSVSLEAKNLEALLNEQKVDIKALRLSADPVELKGDLSLTNFSQPEVKGQLSSNSFNLKQLLQNLGQTAPETADADVLSDLSFSATLAGNDKALSLKPLKLKLDDTQLDGEASLTLASQAIALKLKGNDLNVDRYLPPKTEASGETTSGSETKTAKAPQEWPKDEVIPLEPLQALNLSAELDMDSLTVNGIELGKPGLSLSAKSGLIQLTRFGSQVFSGQASATARIDARKKPLSISVSKQLTNLEMGEALQTLANNDTLTGKFSAKTELNMSGQSIHAWVNSLNGSASLHMAEGVINGIDAAQALCQGINNVSALWIDAKQVDKSTPFADMGASFNIRNGVVSNQDLSAKMDALTVAGKGSVNLPQQTLDYRVGAKIENNLFNESCSVNNRLQGLEVPVDCKGSFYDEPAKLCRLDTRFITDAIKAEAKRKVEEKVSEKLEGKLKDKLGEEGASNLLKGLLGQ